MQNSVERILKGELSPIKTSCFGETRYYVSARGEVDLTPLKIIGKLPGAEDWWLLHKPNGQVCCINRVLLVRHLPSNAGIYLKSVINTLLNPTVALLLWSAFAGAVLLDLVGVLSWTESAFYAYQSLYPLLQQR